MRIKKYFEEYPAYVTDRLAHTAEALNAKYGTEEKALAGAMAESFDRLFLRAADMQAREQKAEIAWVSVSYLRSSLLTETYDLRIDLYDANFYLDVNEVSGYWNGAFVYAYFREDMAYYTKMAREEMIRIMPGEMKAFMIGYSAHYQAFLRCFCRKHLPRITELPSYQKMQKAADIKFTFGEYLDKTTVIYPGSDAKGGFPR